MSNFIKKHLISKIVSEIDIKKKSTKECNFYYFNTPIVENKRLLNRVSRFNAFEKDQIIGIGWNSLSGKSLVGIYDRIKNNDFFFYKIIDNKSYKAKLKKNVETDK